MEPKTILISGGTYGIGKGTAWRLLHDGHNVAVFSRDQKKVSAFRQELKVATKTRSLVFRGDVTSERRVKSIVQRSVQRFGAIDVLINGAGFGYFDEADTVDIKRFDAKEIARRKKLAGGKMPAMLQVGDISNSISFICAQPSHCDIQDVTLMPF